MSGRLSERVKFMNAVCEASALIRQIGGEGSAKAVIRQAHTRLRTWTWNRVRDFYHADMRVRPRSEEMDELRAIAKAKTQEDNDPSIAELRAQLQIVVAHLHRIDPTFHHPSIEALSRAAHPGGDKTTRSGGTDGDDE